MTETDPIANDPYAAPAADLHVEIDVGDMPGLKRLPYFLANIGLYIAIVGSAFFLNQAPSLWWLFLLVIIVPPFVIFYFRLKNIGSPGWYTLLLLVPVVNVFLGVMALAYPPGYAIHRTMDTAGNIIIGILISLFILGLIAGALDV